MTNFTPFDKFDLTYGGFSAIKGASYEDIKHETEARKQKGLIEPYKPKKLGKRAKRRKR